MVEGLPAYDHLGRVYDVFSQYLNEVIPFETWDEIGQLGTRNIERFLDLLLTSEESDKDAIRWLQNVLRSVPDNSFPTLCRLRGERHFSPRRAVLFNVRGILALPEPGRNVWWPCAVSQYDDSDQVMLPKVSYHGLTVSFRHNHRGNDLRRGCCSARVLTLQEFQLLRGLIKDGSPLADLWLRQAQSAPEEEPFSIERYRDDILRGREVYGKEIAG